MKGFISKVDENSYIGFIVTFNKKGDHFLYLNTSPKELKEVKEILLPIVDKNIVISSNLPDYILDWSNKINLIQKGFDQDTSSVNLDYSEYTTKQAQIIKFCFENIPVNEIYPYSKVADLAGLPKAQRFVGSTMKKLRQPYIVPVHRVKSLKHLKKGQKISKKMPL